MAKILIVDDSSDMLNVFQWLLKKKGYDSVTTYSKDGLFYKLGKFTPSMIILDCKLIGENGREICRQIKQDPTTKDIPVILCSGDHYLLNDLDECMADDFLQKPFEVKIVIEKIDTILKQRLEKAA
jgi:DNA-binding response OmpR family regulator